MTGVLRFAGLLTAAIWLGGAVFFSFVAGQVPFSSEMQALLGRLGPANAEFAIYLRGAIAQIGVARFFDFQLICCIIALAHLAAEWLYQERRGRKFLLGLLLAILSLTLLGGYVMQPKLKTLHGIKYAPNYPAAQRDAAAKSFKMWHATSQVANLFVLGGLVIYLLHMGRPPETARFVRPTQFRS